MAHGRGGQPQAREQRRGLQQNICGAQPQMSLPVEQQHVQRCCEEMCGHASDGRTGNALLRDEQQVEGRLKRSGGQQGQQPARARRPGPAAARRR